MTRWLTIGAANGATSGKQIVDPKGALACADTTDVANRATEPAMPVGFLRLRLNVGSTSAARMELAIPEHSSSAQARTSSSCRPRRGDRRTDAHPVCLKR